jgi:hypothetical protein
LAPVAVSVFPPFLASRFQLSALSLTLAASLVKIADVRPVTRGTESKAVRFALCWRLAVQPIANS